MDIEGKIRSRIEAILINDAKNSAEIQKMATEDEPLEADPFAEERNLYQRIINNYRSAVSEVNSLLEQNIGLLSGLFRAVDNIKGCDDFSEIGSKVVECLLQDFGAEYSSVIVFQPEILPGVPLCLEGIREERAFFRAHVGSTLIGLSNFDQIVERMSQENADFLNFGDVYRESMFEGVDFPSVVRSMVCLPIKLGQDTLGLLLLSHSLPNYFSDNHVRVLKILSSTLAHLKTVLAARTAEAHAPTPAGEGSAQATPREQDVLSVVLLDFVRNDPYGRGSEIGLDSIRAIRSRLQNVLQSTESISFYEERVLIVLLPEVTAEELPARIRMLQNAFAVWKTERGDRAQNIRMNAGSATCRGEEDLARMLEIASQLWRQERNGLSVRGSI